MVILSFFFPSVFSCGGSARKLRAAFALLIVAHADSVMRLVDIFLDGVAPRSAWKCPADMDDLALVALRHGWIWFATSSGNSSGIDPAGSRSAHAGIADSGGQHG